MKQFVLAMLLCITTFGIAQNSVTERTITTYGSVAIESKEVLYKTDINLSLENSYYADNPCTTVEELKSKYFEALKEKGVDTSKFIQDDLAYAATGYRKGGTTLHFETKDKDEILSVTSINMAQVMPSYVQVKDLVTEKQTKELVAAAIADAQKNAYLLAEASGEKIDRIYSISSYDLDGNSYWRTPSSEPSYLRLTVVYLLKD
ncbi:SIMPL domain-containing protein [Winogradskyella litoriviva]|uniref:SIMPL domain-containing protein n=1 Tax=Winogradskyella litoriviva TaxID=1220182 RepID=A0ABX2E4P5_9FLAO|nr:SIMPL domain-containing protein [Winogradskyella litoriviva]NRD22759.1 SIMPL domain-containing protein [Winogradskyella litoriviva]